jgi:hypothetical protein
VILTASEDLASPQKQILFARDADLSKQTIDTYTKQVSGNVDVADAGDETFGIGDIASPAKGLYLEVSAACSVYLSGDPNPLVLRLPPSPQSGAKAKLFVEADITSFRIEATEGVAVAGTYCLWGGGTT